MTTPPQLATPLTRLTGVDHPIVQTGMGWVAGARLVSATAEAGALGILASATMTYDELERQIIEVAERTDRPFGVNLRADAGDATERVELLIRHGVKVASFALAPRRELIERLKDNGVVVIPSIGAVRHAEKVAAWGADAVMVQGGEGGGHTGAVPTSILLPSVVAAVDIPVIAAGGFHTAAASPPHSPTVPRGWAWGPASCSRATVRCPRRSSSVTSASVWTAPS